MKSISIYARVSSEHQVRQATIESQVACLKKRALEDGHRVLPQDLYIDEGFSGASLVRPALERLRDRAAEGTLDVVYVLSPDRLARKYAYQVVLLEELQRHGAQVVFVQGPRGETAEDELLVQMQGMIAEYERAKITERCRRGMLHKARKGSLNPMGRAPYGYRYIPKSENGEAQYQIVLHETKVVRRIFEAMVHEHKSINQIAKELTEAGVPTKGGRAWHRNSVWAILNNPAYSGRAAYGRRKAVPRRKALRIYKYTSPAPRNANSSREAVDESQWIYIDVPAIVPEELFVAARTQLERNKRLKGRYRKAEYLLSGLVVCACCGYAYMGRQAFGRRYRYYACAGTRRQRFADHKAVCDNAMVRVDMLDEQVWRAVCELLQDPRRLLEEWSQRSQQAGLPRKALTERDQAEKSLAKQERLMRRLVDAYEADAIELEELKRRGELVRARIQRAQQDLALAQAHFAQATELTSVVTRLEDFAARIRTNLDSMAWQERQQLVRTLITRVEIDRQDVKLVYRVAEPNPADAGAAPTGRTFSGAGPSSNCHLRPSSQGRA